MTTGTGSGKKGGGGQFVLVLLVLLLGVGGAGFFVGYTQNFVPIEMVAPDSASAKPASTAEPAATTPATTTPTATPANASSDKPASAAASTPMKKAYWISTHGWDNAGYAITVSINGQEVGTFSAKDKTEDITKYIKLGDNKVHFVAKAVTENRNDYNGAHLIVKINQGTKLSAPDASTLVEYKREVSETGSFDDTMDFAVAE